MRMLHTRATIWINNDEQDDVEISCEHYREYRNEGEDFQSIKVTLNGKDITDEVYRDKSAWSTITDALEEKAYGDNWIDD